MQTIRPVCFQSHGPEVPESQRVCSGISWGFVNIHTHSLFSLSLSVSLSLSLPALSHTQMVVILICVAGRVWIKNVSPRKMKTRRKDRVKWQNFCLYVTLCYCWCHGEQCCHDEVGFYEKTRLFTRWNVPLLMWRAQISLVFRCFCTWLLRFWHVNKEMSHVKWKSYIFTCKVTQQSYTMGFFHMWITTCTRENKTRREIMKFASSHVSSTDSKVIYEQRVTVIYQFIR